MWFIGHLAFAYILLKCITLGKTRFTSKFLFLLFLFSNLIDFLHFPVLRFYIHNLPGSFLITIICLWILHKKLKLHQNEMILLFLASTSHIIADILFGTFFVLFPLNTNAYSVFPWNGIEDMTAEFFLGEIFLIQLFLSGEAKAFATYNFKHFYAIGLMIFYVFCLLQTMLYIYMNVISTCYWCAFLMLLLMILFICYLSKIVLSRIRWGDISFELP